MQKLGKNPNFGVISEIQWAQFGVFVTYIFGGKIWGSNKNFRGKFWGQAPQPPNMEASPRKQGQMWISCLKEPTFYLKSQLIKLAQKKKRTIFETNLDPN